MLDSSFRKFLSMLDPLNLYSGKYFQGFYKRPTSKYPHSRAASISCTDNLTLKLQLSLAWGSISRLDQRPLEKWWWVEISDFRGPAGIFFQHVILSCWWNGSCARDKTVCEVRYMQFWKKWSDPGKWQWINISTKMFRLTLKPKPWWLLAYDLPRPLFLIKFI